MLRQLQKREGESEQLRQASKERARKAMTLEQAFMQIRQATGVTTLDEMVAKFMGQGANKKALEDEKAEAERRLARIKEQKKAAEDEFAQLKASDLGGTELSRERIAKYEAEISTARAQLKVSKAACERLEGVLVAVRQGAVGLAQRLAPFDFLDEGPTEKKAIDDDDSSESNASDAKVRCAVLVSCSVVACRACRVADGVFCHMQSSRDTLENLMASERKLVRMLQAMSAASVVGLNGTAPAPGASQGAAGGTGGSGADLARASAGGGRGDTGGFAAGPHTAHLSFAGDDSARPWTPKVNNDPKVHHNNVRVSSILNRAQDTASVRTPRSHDADSDDDSDDGKGRLESRADIKKRARKRYQEEQRKRDVRGGGMTCCRVGTHFAALLADAASTASQETRAPPTEPEQAHGSAECNQQARTLEGFCARHDVPDPETGPVVGVASGLMYLGG